VKATVLARLAIGASLGAERGAVVVCIPVFGRHELVERCLEGVLAHTAADVPIVVADDASADDATERHLEVLAASETAAARLWYLRQERNVGFVENVNTVFGAAAPADVVILNSDCEVGPGWLAGLRAAAYSDSLVATATSLTNHGTIVSVPFRNEPRSSLPQGTTTAELAVAVEAASLRLRPHIPTMVGHCAYVKRSALDLVGTFDPAFSPGYGEEVDFSQRCLLRGLVHVVADDVFVYHRGGASFDGSGRKARNAELIRERYPYYDALVDATEADETGPLARAVNVAARAVGELSVTIDARCLLTTVTGTQVHVLELIQALHRTERLRLRVLVQPDIGAAFRASLEALEGVEILASDSVTPETPRTTILHRPYQVFDVRDLELIGRLGQRFTVTHQDLISFRNPDYFRSFAEWRDFQRLTRLTLALAHSVLFFSEHAAVEAQMAELVDPRRTRVVRLGVDHTMSPEEPTPSRPPALPEHAADAFLLCLGTNFVHKNREFAIRLLDALQRRHDWDGWLIFAGPHATRGTSQLGEAALVAENPLLNERTADIGEVTEAEKRWLLREAKGVVYPTVHEGFGLIPFEAATAGTPCFFAEGTALTELLPPSAATLVPWDADASADAIVGALSGSTDAARLVGLVQGAAETLTWERTASEIVAAYEATLREPGSAIASLAAESESPPALASRLATRALGELALPDDVYRALLAILTRPKLRESTFALLRFGHRAGRVVRRALRRNANGVFVK
jgi:GT2 family glycosyltransferase/glycosyltransferase involved in cell wall biosynthesis